MRLLIPPTDPSRGRTSNQGYDDFNLTHALIGTVGQLILSLVFYTLILLSTNMMDRLDYLLVAGAGQMLYALLLPAEADSVNFTDRWIRAIILVVLASAPLVTFIGLFFLGIPIANAISIAAIVGIITAVTVPIPLFLILGG